MARQNDDQRETIERVMHEFKEGELETSHGRRVSNPRQAIAIALSEAGASNQQSEAENRSRLNATKRRERAAGEIGASGEPAPSRATLYAEAKKRAIPGRSKMSKDELRAALDRRD